MKMASTRKFKLTIIFLWSQGTSGEEKFHKESVQGTKFVIVPVGRNFEDEKTLQQKLVEMNCEGLFYKQAKTIAEGTKINSSRLTQACYSNQKKGYQVNSGNFLGNIDDFMGPSWNFACLIVILRG